MKAFFLLSLLALAAVSTAYGQFNDVLAQQCQEEEQMTMGSCRDYLMQRCRSSSVMILARPWQWGMSSCRALRQRCCQQLEQTEEQCRCKAICRTIHGGMLGGQMTVQVLEKVRSLPSMCNMYPSYCNISSSGVCY